MLTNNLSRRLAELIDVDRLAEALAGLADPQHSEQERVIAETAIAVHLYRTGRVADALPLLERAAARPEAQPEIFAFLGMALRSQQRFADSAQFLKRALQLRPDWPSVLYNLGATLYELKDFTQSLAANLAAIGHSPTMMEAWNGAGLALAAMGKHDEAQRHYDEAVRLSPDSADVLNNLGISLRALGKAQRAQAIYERCLALRPDSAEMLNNLGVAHETQGNTLAALDCYTRSVQQRPDYADGHAHRGIALLRLGRFAEGWREYEWRWRAGDMARNRRNFNQPEWDGRSDLTRRRFLLHAEQGLGDTVQSVRYAALLAQRGATVTVECGRPLLSLVARVGGVARAVAKGDPLGAFDVHCSMMSLPHRLATTLESIPAPRAYIHADPVRQTAWFRRLPPRDGRLRVGLVWQGNPNHRNDRHRSCELRRFGALASVPGIQWISLQKPIKEVPPSIAPPGLVLEPHIDRCADFEDTAALIANLDLVIGVDTSVIHLSAAMGIPTWTMLPTVPDWRWLLDREDSPWYSTMRLFRQRVIGSWEPVIESMAERLAPLPRPMRSPYRKPDAGPLITAVLTRVDAATFAWLGQSQALLGNVRIVVAISEPLDAVTRTQLDVLRDGGVVDQVVDTGQASHFEALRAAIAVATTPYVLWVDRDVRFSEPDWPTVFDRFVRTAGPFEVAGYCAFHRRSTAYQSFVERRPWWNGVAGLSAAQIKRVPFPLGGCVLMRRAFVSENDFPDRFLDPGRLDVALGDLVGQRRGRLAAFPWYVSRCFDWERWPVEPATQRAPPPADRPLRGPSLPSPISMPAQSRERRRLVIGILTARHRHALQAMIRECWLRSAHALPQVEAFFIEGADSAIHPGMQRVDDRLRVPTSDGPESLQAKVAWFARYALDTYSFDYVFKCDDDTFVHVPRLLRLIETEPDPGDYRGFNHGRTCNVHDYAHGGAGYLMSAAACEAICESPIESFYEDFINGERLHARGIALHHDERFRRQFDAARLPMPGNDFITAHCVTTRERLDFVSAPWDAQLNPRTRT